MRIKGTLGILQKESLLCEDEKNQSIYFYFIPFAESYLLLFDMCSLPHPPLQVKQSFPRKVHLAELIKK
jgi:hypothetical protein